MPRHHAPSASGRLLLDAAERAISYLDHLGERRVAVSAEALTGLQALDERFPERPTSPEAVLQLLDNIGSPATTATAGGRFFGYVTGGALPVALASNWLAGSWDQDAGMASVCPINATLEEVARRWLLEILGLPAESGAAFVTGGTLANVSALAAARHAVLTRAGWDPDADGLFGAPAVTIVVSDEVHVSVLKALGLLGFGRQRVMRAPVDRHGRMRVDTVPPLRGPTIVCVQAGNVNTGACDPVREICEVAHEAGAWVHVDGAFGLWAAAAPERAHLVAGIGEADSWAVDAHKWLNVPYDSGIAFVRDASALSAAMGTTAAYLATSRMREPDQYTPEMSRRARGVEVWAALRSLGREGLAAMIEQNCRQAERFATGLAAAGHEVLNDVVLNQLIVSFGSAEETRRVIAELQADGTCWCSGTVWQGRTAMRISVSSWATTDDDVERSLAAMVRIGNRVRAASVAG
jgi:glutamate/tyrosine decarboxylase-like PLP-dependent enzyme